MIGGPGSSLQIHGFGLSSSVTRQRIKPGTVRRIIPYGKNYKWSILILLIVAALDAAIAVATPLLFRVLIDNGIAGRHLSIVIDVAIAVAALAVLDAGAEMTEALVSGRVSQGLIFDLRTVVFAHVQRQPLAFFTRAQTGSLVSRLNTDVMGAQQAISSLLSQAVSSILSLIFVLATMFVLSWEISLAALVALPLFVLPGRLVGRRLQRLTRESMQLNAEMGSVMNERFNVAGAMLTKLYGRPGHEEGVFASRAERVRDIGVITGVYSKMLFVSIALLAALATALVYGLGGSLAISGAFQIGTLVALATLLTRLFGPVNNLSSLQSNVMTALVSFDRVFEVLDLKPLISERPGAISLTDAESAGTVPDVEFDSVSFHYPAAHQVSLASLESVALPSPERADNGMALRDVSFRLPAGSLTALVGRSGAGKTTTTYLVPRLYDPDEGSVRIGGCDVRDLTLESLHDVVGMIPQDAHFFHDTVRSNLAYARPGAIEAEMIQACEAAQIWNLIALLPNGLDTVLGDRGYRLSGGERQRLAIARLLLKAPSVVVLDEATAHLDSESEKAVQLALKTALAGRTSLVIAHRLSTIREADQILAMDGGQIIERGTHEELIEAGGLYADLYHTQFAKRGGPSHGEPQHGEPPRGEPEFGEPLAPMMFPGGPGPRRAPGPFGPFPPG